MFERTISFWRRLMGNKPTDSYTDDRRVYTRYPVDHQIAYQTQEVGEKLLARLRDISLGGVKMVVDRPYEPGDLLSVDLPEDKEYSTSTVLACVVHVDEDQEQWSLGCTFARELTPEDLGKMGANFKQESGADARSRPRHACNIRASYQVVGSECEPEVIEADVLNISTTGIGLLAHEHMPAGTLLNVELHAVHGKKSVTMLSCVIHTSDREADDQALGCNFITEMSEEDLRELLAD